MKGANLLRAGVLILVLMSGSALAANSNHNVTAQMNNVAPTITFVQSLSSANPTQNGVTTILGNFTANDKNKVADLNSSSASCALQNDGTVRTSASCTPTTLSTSSINYQCNIGLQYYDTPGTWTLNCTVADNAGLRVHSQPGYAVSLTYNTLFAVALDKSVMDFGTLTLGTVQAASTNPIAVLNQGNVNVGNISIKGYDLSTVADSIPASAINSTSVQSPAVSAFMINNTYVSMDALTINYGVGAFKSFSYYMTVPSELESGTYTSASPWVIYTST